MQNSTKCCSEMFNNVTVLNAVSRAWREVEVSTIVNVLIYVVLIN